MNKAERVESLQQIFSNISNWLSFAEAKNGALLAINAGVICGVLSIGEKISYLQFWVCVGLLISTLMLLWSFCPNTKSASDSRNRQIAPTSGTPKNLLFYGDIAQFEAAEKYLDCLFNIYYGVALSEESVEEKHYAEEIWINSKITMKKYRAFRWALIIDMITCIVSVLGLIILTV